MEVFNMTGGFLGKILWVDLSNNKIKEEDLDEKICRDFIGGYGLGARILFNRIEASADPLGPDNILGIVTGPLTGTDALGGSRYVVVGKSPLTNSWGEANSGGDFGPHLKFAGYDAIFFTGVAELSDPERGVTVRCQGHVGEDLAQAHARAEFLGHQHPVQHRLVVDGLVVERALAQAEG